MNEVTNAELKTTWNRNAPDDHCWACTKCTHRTTLGAKAAAHALTKKHGPPKLDALRPEEMMPDSPRKPELVVRAGDMMQVGEDLRLALEVARIATQLAETAGASSAQVNQLRRMIASLGG